MISINRLERISKVSILILSSIAVTACGGKSNGDSSSNPPTAVNAAPTAKISSVSDMDERQSQSLDGSTSSDSDGTISTYAWDLSGAGDLNVSLTGITTSNATLTVGELGNPSPVSITVGLTVTDNDGATNRIESTLTLTELDFALLPPDPGRASLNSLGGPDTDADGVRDDIEHALYTLYPLDKSMRDVNGYGAKSMQMALLAGDASVDTQSDAAAQELALFADCLVQMQFDNDLPFNFAMKQMGLIEELVANTPERRTAMDSYDTLRAGTAVTATEAQMSDCVAG